MVTRTQSATLQGAVVAIQDADAGPQDQGARNVCCLCWSHSPTASRGPFVAYQHDGEERLARRAAERVQIQDRAEQERVEHVARRAGVMSIPPIPLPLPPPPHQVHERCAAERLQDQSAKRQPHDCPLCLEPVVSVGGVPANQILKDMTTAMNRWDDATLNGDEETLQTCVGHVSSDMLGRMLLTATECDFHSTIQRLLQRREEIGTEDLEEAFARAIQRHHPRPLTEQLGEEIASRYSRQASAEVASHEISDGGAQRPWTQRAAARSAAAIATTLDVLSEAVRLGSHEF